MRLIGHVQTGTAHINIMENFEIQLIV